jgi:hypothetical protein
MSPEQARGAAVDKRADIWAFGIVLYEMLTGRRTFAEETVSDTLAAVLKTEPNWSALPRDTPVPIRRLLRRCLERDRKRRLPDIAIARIEIDEALSAPPDATVATPPAPPSKRALLPWALAALATLAALALAILHFRETRPPERVLRYSIPAPEKSTIQNFALSPDGRYLAIAAEQDGKRRLWVRALDALQSQLLPGTDDATLPFWSPDSAYIGFFAQGKLRKIAVNGGPAQTLCDAANTRGGTWNREGVVLFATLSGIQRVPAAGGVPAPLTKFDAVAGYCYPTFLPGGRRFLYLIVRAAEKSGVYVGSYGQTVDRRAYLCEKRWPSC